MNKIKDEFTDLSIPSRKKWELRKLRDKKCFRCDDSATQGRHCARHHAAQLQWQRSNRLTPAGDAMNEKQRLRYSAKEGKKRAEARIRNRSFTDTFKVNDRMLKAVRHHMARGRDAATIAVWMEIPILKIKAVMETITKETVQS